MIEKEKIAYIAADEEEPHDEHRDAGGDNKNPRQLATKACNVSFSHDEPCVQIKYAAKVLWSAVACYRFRGASLLALILSTLI